MKSLLIVLIFFSSNCFADSKNKKSSLGTNFEFSEADVNGRYNTSGEGLSIVEDEKSILDLLALRKNFKDRVKTNLRVQK
ncbi:MAG: hypothetical protein KDD58_02090 [Bdellovibrionales bacterium]|nr:hypothetical protein [Bdellovibrionales bacterium]